MSQPMDELRAFQARFTIGAVLQHKLARQVRPDTYCYSPQRDPRAPIPRMLTGEICPYVRFHLPDRTRVLACPGPGECVWGERIRYDD